MLIPLVFSISMPGLMCGLAHKLWKTEEMLPLFVEWEKM